MLLNLREILRKPGSLSFEFELDPGESGLDFVSVERWNGALAVKGVVTNSSAGALDLSATVESSAAVRCDLCGELYERAFLNGAAQTFTARLSEELQDEDNPDFFPVNGGFADIGDIIRTLFILDLPTQFLCSGCTESAVNSREV